MNKLSILTFMIILFSKNGYSEYRVYQYLISPQDNYSRPQADSKIIVSTFHPKAYQQFYGQSFEKINFLRTWICPGYTGQGLDICPHPWDKEKKEE